jgi:hypothetical protein
MVITRLKKNILLPGVSFTSRAARFVTQINPSDKAPAVLVAVFALLAISANHPARAENPEISSRRAAERLDFSNDEIKDGFFKIAFTAEMQVGAPAMRVRKFDEPVRIFVDSKAQPDRSAEIAKVVADIRVRINHLDMAITDDRDAANFVVMLVSDSDVSATIRERYGSDRAKDIEKSLNPQCLSGIGKDKQFRIRRAEAILPVDAGEFTFYDCAYEELLQALGAINDDRSVPWTMFNDDVQMGFFDVYDQYLLNILYDPRVRPGMTKDEVRRLMPELLVTARSWVQGTSRQGHAEPRDGQGKVKGVISATAENARGAGTN